MFKFERGNVVGEEDLIDKSDHYTTTVVCTTLHGLLGQMKKEDFLRLENQAYAWTALLKNAKLKQMAVARSITLKNNVVIEINSTSDRENQRIAIKNQEQRL